MQLLQKSNYKRHGLEYGYSQPISAHVTSHHSKAGTPTMGGIVFVIAWICIVFLHANNIPNSHSKGKYSIIYPYILIPVAFSLLGLYDDVKKIYYKSNSGIRAKNKFIFQCLISFLLTYLLFNVSLFKAIWWSFVITATANALNITDGLDGLAVSCSIIIIATISLITSNAIGLLFLFSILIFLQFNKYPARIFMGDTGSMLLGSVIAILFLTHNLEWYLTISGLVLVLETLSVIIQISSIKLCNKKIFKMSPIHHHLEHYLHEKTITKLAIFITIVANLLIIYLI
ncbi:MAG: hypothetical protein H6845_00645 [Alphaproteobacteria bacterium]|nr:MAG: hypothetical protein H6845_00645 [Alphaproteobacteria bacterium]